MGAITVHMNGHGLLRRLMALVLGLSLMVLPQALNSRSLILLMDDYGTVPAPLAEEEEVKHACSIGWSTVVYSTNDHLLHAGDVPALDDPYNTVDHGEVAVPPPKG